MSLSYIITEGERDREILEKLLPNHLVEASKFVVGLGRYGVESLARSVIAVKQVPVAIVLDARTDNKQAVREQLNLVHLLLEQVSPGIPFQVCLAVPEIEAIFLQSRSLIERLAKRKFTDLEWNLAKSQPKEFLKMVLGGDIDRQGILKEASETEFKELQQHPLIGEISQFLSSLSQTPSSV